MNGGAIGAAAIHPLVAADAAALRVFECRAFRQPWTDVVEEVIQERLADVIAEGYA